MIKQCFIGSRVTPRLCATILTIFFTFDTARADDLQDLLREAEQSLEPKDSKKLRNKTKRKPDPKHRLRTSTRKEKGSSSLPRTANPSVKTKLKYKTGTVNTQRSIKTDLSKTTIRSKKRFPTKTLPSPLQPTATQEENQKQALTRLLTLDIEQLHLSQERINPTFQTTYAVGGRRFLSRFPLMKDDDRFTFRDTQLLPGGKVSLRGIWTFYNIQNVTPSLIVNASIGMYRGLLHTERRGIQNVDSELLYTSLPTSLALGVHIQAPYPIAFSVLGGVTAEALQQRGHGQLDTLSHIFMSDHLSCTIAYTGVTWLTLSIQGDISGLNLWFSDRPFMTQSLHFGTTLKL